MIRRYLAASLVLTIALVVPAPGGAAEPPKLRTLDSHFPFTPPDSLEAWQARSEAVRHQIRVAVGMWPMPETSQAAPWIGSERVFEAAGEAPGYSVAPITIEALPGLMVTGSLYRPHPAPTEPGIGVLCPHGHWAEGRFHDAGEAAARRAIANGAERYIAAARSPLQARCVQLARMGCTVLLYDMLGYADSQQISLQRAHGFARQSDEEDQPNEQGWLLFSPLAEAHLQSPMGLQTISTIRALEAMAALPEVDPARIAITGASGGGTQSFIAAAIEPRIAAAFPAVMVSTGMQGGCTCENACLLRDGTGNIEIAATIAPRPLGLTAADDWTRTMPEDGYPELKQLYGLFGAADAVELHAAVHFGHNYNHVSRTAMYGWLNRVFGLGMEAPVLESDFQRLEPAEMTVWSDSHPEPEGGLPFERQLLHKWAEGTQQKMAAAVEAATQDGGAAFDQLVAAGWRTVIGPRPQGATITDESITKSTDSQGARLDARVVFNGNEQVVLAARWPAKAPKGILITAHPKGSELLEATTSQASSADGGQSQTQQAIAAAVAAGWAVVVAELEGADEERQPLVREDRLAAAFTYGYNPARVVRQARQLVAAADGAVQLAQRKDGAQDAAGIPVRLVGDDSAAPAAAIARAMAPERFDACVLRTGGFRFADVPSIAHTHFLPGSARYLDLPGLLAVPAAGSLTVVGESPEDLAVTQQVFEGRRMAGNEQPSLRIVAGGDVDSVWHEALAD